MSLIEQLILFVAMPKVPTETNDEYLDRFNSQPQNLMLSGGEHSMCSLKTMDKLGATYTPEEVTIE